MQLNFLVFLIWALILVGCQAGTKNGGTSPQASQTLLENSLGQTTIVPALIETSTLETDTIIPSQVSAGLEIEASERPSVPEPTEQALSNLVLVQRNKSINGY